jgi:EAL and modified HD-GYP domain-containing signal transduction protein
MLYAEPGKRGHNQTPLLMLATTRGRLMELLAQRLRPGQRYVAEIAFTVGIMSLMDTLFGIPMADIVEQIPVSEEVSEALLRRTGFFGELLKLAECIERIEEMDDHIIPTLRDLAMSTDELVELEMAAFEWSDNVVRYASVRISHSASTTTAMPTTTEFHISSRLSAMRSTHGDTATQIPTSRLSTTAQK